MTANATSVPLGRKLLVREASHCRALLSHLQSPSAVPATRQGCAVALRNLLLDKEHALSLLERSGEALVPALLLPLTPGDAARGDEQLREACADAVAALAASAEGRAALWAAGAPKLLQRAYEEETAEGVNSALEHAAGLLVTQGRTERRRLGASHAES